MTGVRQCAVLVGGLGSRLGSIVADVPKPMLAVAGRPFLWWLLREVSRFGIEDVVLLTAHLSEVVEAALPDMVAALPRAMRVVVSREPVRAGTGGALFHAQGLLQERFLLMNGDSFFDCALGAALGGAEEVGVVGRLMLRAVEDASRYGVVEVDGERVTAFRARAAAAGAGVINGGLYVFNRRVLEHVSAACSLEQEVLPELAAAGALRATLENGRFIDIGVPEDLVRAQAELPRWLARPALFLDRDGVCNVDHGWVGTRERFEWVAGAKAAIVAASLLGWHVFVVTNQSGVARGHYTEADVRALHRWMLDEVLEAGGTIDDFRFCPFHPEAPLEAYRRVSDWRKPGPGMIFDLLRTWGVDARDALMVGDQPTDMAAAEAAGVAGHLFSGENLSDFVLPLLEAHAKRKEVRP